MSEKEKLAVVIPCYKVKNSILNVIKTIDEKVHKIIIIDDLLATGGTVDACVKLCQQQGAEVIGNLFVIELEGLGAREKLLPIPCESLLSYPA